MTELEHEVQLFNKGERVLCYEPDETKAKVLYTSKVLAITERRDEIGLLYYEYKIHFQGWSPSYDRYVRSTCLLKDTEENRQYQRELAEASRLQIRGSYSYKGTSSQPPLKKKRLRRGQVEELNSSDPLDISQETDTEQEAPAPFKVPYSDTGAMRGKRARMDPPATTRTPKALAKDVAPETEIIEKFKEDRVMLLISERLREYMEYDYDMVVTRNKQHAIPATMPIVTILENFVKQRAVELAISIKQDSSRARNTQSRCARMEREYDRVMSKVCLLKEVVDGIRIYFEFNVDQHLLYKKEKEYTRKILTEECMRNCKDLLIKSDDESNSPTSEADLSFLDDVPSTSSAALRRHANAEAMLFDPEYGNKLPMETKGFLWESNKELQKCLRYIDKTSDRKSIQAYGTSPFEAANKLPMEMRGFLWETFNWRLLSTESPPEKSMVFGAPHLARLMVKLPECLNASPISNEKLEDLLPHLDSFINYLENHKEWFDKENYIHNVFIKPGVQRTPPHIFKQPNPPVDVGRSYYRPK